MSRLLSTITGTSLLFREDFIAKSLSRAVGYVMAQTMAFISHIIVQHFRNKMYSCFT